jgi:hypothetical protein
MSALYYDVEPAMDFPDTDVNDVAFIRATTMIGGRDAIEEFLVCEMYPLVAGFGFKNVTTSRTSMSRVEVPLPIFLVEPISTESTDCFLAKVETNAEKVLGSYMLKEHDTCMAATLPNSGRLN